MAGAFRDLDPDPEARSRTVLLLHRHHRPAIHVELVNGVPPRIASLADGLMDVVKHTRREFPSEDRPGVVYPDQHHSPVRVREGNDGVLDSSPAYPALALDLVILGRKRDGEFVRRHEERYRRVA